MQIDTEEVAGFETSRVYHIYHSLNSYP
jgi:hypothetical protein